MAYSTYRAHAFGAFDLETPDAYTLQPVMIALRQNLAASLIVIPPATFASA